VVGTRAAAAAAFALLIRVVQHLTGSALVAVATVTVLNGASIFVLPYGATPWGNLLGIDAPSPVHVAAYWSLLIAASGATAWMLTRQLSMRPRVRTQP
jgi:hypothetical protein